MENNKTTPEELKKALLRLKVRWQKEIAGKRRLRLKTLPRFCLELVLPNLTSETKFEFGRVMYTFERYIRTAANRGKMRPSHCALISVLCTKFDSVKFWRSTSSKLKRMLGIWSDRFGRQLIYDYHIAVMTEYPESIPLVRQLYPKCPHCIILSIYFPHPK